MEIKDFKVGQRVYIQLTNNAARGKDKDKLIEEWEVTKVGRKFVTVKNGYMEYQFYKHDSDFYKNCLVQKTDYSPNYLLYDSMETIKAEWLRAKRETEVERFIRYSNLSKLSDSELETIYNIIKTKE